MWMNGNPFPSPIKPYLRNWEKINMTSETRKADSVMCGGSRDEGQPYYTGDEEARILPSETIGKTRVSLRIEWVNCMEKPRLSLRKIIENKS